MITQDFKHFKVYVLNPFDNTIDINKDPVVTLQSHWEKKEIYLFPSKNDSLIILGHPISDEWVSIIAVPMLL